MSVAMKPSISIIICNYNYELYVGEAIASALGQTYPPKEIVVVDDGSTDGSREKIAQFDGIKTIFKANGGQTSGVRAALAEVSGDLTLILDSDDYLLPHACETIVAQWRKGITLVQYRLEKRTNDGVVKGYYPDPPFLHGGERAFVLKYGFIPASPTSGNAFDTSHVKNAFASNQARDRSYTDGYLIFTAPLYGDVLSLDEVLGVYRLHGANVTSLTQGKTIRYLKNYVGTNFSHRQGLAHHVAALGISPRPAKSYLSPYEWRAALQLKRLSPDEPEVANYSSIEIMFRGIWGFFRFPKIPLAKRVLNVAAMGVMTFAPVSVVRRTL
jgi:glycosyltransferase involved in cell wall biosynthesis